MEYAFKKIKLNNSEKIWLKAIHNKSENDDIIDIKIKLRPKLQKDFDYKKIDRWVCRGNYLTLIGIWLIDNKNSVFNNIPRIISFIKESILNNSKIDLITAKEISSATMIKEYDVETALFLMSDIGIPHKGASVRRNGRGYTSISIRDESIYDSYLNFSNIEDLMEKFYSSKTPDMPFTYGAIPMMQTPFGIDYSAEEAKKEEVKRNTAFIIMHMNSQNTELEDILNAIKDVCKMFGIIGMRADEIEHSDKITDIILEEIRTSEYLIADLSHERPNVYYEIGYAHANNKKPIMYRKKGTKLHFDLSVHNVPEYKNITDLKKKLILRFEEILGRKLKKNQ